MPPLICYYGLLIPIHMHKAEICEQDSEDKANPQISQSMIQ